MTIFVACALLLVCVVLAIIVPPLWRRRPVTEVSAGRRAANVAIYRAQAEELDAERATGELGDAAYQQARGELQRRLLEDAAEENQAGQAGMGGASRRAAWLLALCIPIAAAAGYGLLGNPQGLDPMAAASSGQVTPEQIEGMVGKLAARLRDKPEDTEGWIMLARSYKMLGRAADAAAAYVRVEDRIQGDPDALTDYADLLASQNNGDLNGKPLALIRKALQADPNHVIALWLAGTAAFNARGYADAATFWERAVKALPAGSDDAGMLAASIAEAKRRGSIKVDASRSVRGRVEIAPALRASVSPDDTVFVFARPVDGSRMPLAIVKLRAGDLPADFTLDDTTAMSAEATLSGHDKVVVLARVSSSGNAVAKAGEPESAPQTVAVGKSGLRIVVDRKH